MGIEIPKSRRVDISKPPRRRVAEIAKHQDPRIEKPRNTGTISQIHGTAKTQNCGTAKYNQPRNAGAPKGLALRISIHRNPEPANSAKSISAELAKFRNLETSEPDIPKYNSRILEIPEHRISGGTAPTARAWISKARNSDIPESPITANTYRRIVQKFGKSDHRNLEIVSRRNINIAEHRNVRISEYRYIMDQNPETSKTKIQNTAIQKSRNITISGYRNPEISRPRNVGAGESESQHPEIEELRDIRWYRGLKIAKYQNREI